MSTDIIINGSCDLHFEADGSYRIAGGLGGSGLVPYNAERHPYRFIIPHADLRGLFSQRGARGFLVHSGGERIAAALAAVDTSTTIITFDGGEKTVEVEQGDSRSTTVVTDDGVAAKITVEAELFITLRVELRPLACTNPPCPEKSLAFEIGLLPG